MVFVDGSYTLKSLVSMEQIPLMELFLVLQQVLVGTQLIGKVFLT